MIQSEKMKSFSKLATSMAHDIKNPLAGVVQNAQVISNRIIGDLEKNREVAETCGISLEKMNLYMKERNIPRMLEAITESVKNANQRIDYMLSFNIRSDTQFKLNNIAQIMDSTVQLENYELSWKSEIEQIRFVREYEENLPDILCDGSKIQQVLFNIIINSAEALKNVPADNREITLRIFRKEKQLVIEIEDNGPGMDQNTLSKIFEPFFTTKGKGLGAGLGLSVSYFIIVENHKGTLAAQSEPGKWTKITITLPI
jgi:signal transduction histidine kinase